MVEELSTEQLDVNLCCEILGVSTAGYYSWLKRPPSKRRQRDLVLCELVAKIHNESRGTYGSKRVHEKLKSIGEKCGKKKVIKLMKQQNLSGVARKKYRIHTTDSNHNLPIADRIFKVEDVSNQVTKPNQVWASDITYIPTKEGWVFLCIYLDLFTRKIVGFSMADNMRTEILINALEMSLGRQLVNSKEILSHTDRGSQYASKLYRDFLEENGITASMSRKGNCWDNAFAESFFHTLKVELVHRESFETRSEAMIKIFEYIEVWYNRQRLHSSLGFKTPVEYETEQLTKAHAA
jgi:transposase InsO family protein